MTTSISRWIGGVALSACVTLSPPLWAAYVVLPRKPVDVTELTTEVKQLVPTLEGMSQDGASVTFRRLQGDFTEDEKGLIDQALNAHDALAHHRRDQDRLQKRNSARTKLKVLGLTEQELDALTTP